MAISQLAKFYLFFVVGTVLAGLRPAEAMLPWKPLRCQVLFQAQHTRKIRYWQLRDVQAVKDLSVPGSRNTGTYEADFEGEHVFLKKSKISIQSLRKNPGKEEAYFLNAIQWTRRAADEDLGPRLLGVTEKDGYLTFVTSFEDGWFVRPSAKSVLPDGFQPTLRLVRKLERIAQFLERERAIPYDLQLLLTEDNAMLIDMEFFRVQSKLIRSTSLIDGLKDFTETVRSRLSK